MAYILKFEPIYKERIWGGRNLEKLFKRKLPKDIKIGESWELADLPADKSRLAIGPDKGKTIDQLIKDWKSDLMGNIELEDGRFPLLVKFLDANDILSVQVHPDYEAAEHIGGGAQAKYEGWFVIEAKPDSFIYRGLKPGVTIRDVEQAIKRGELKELLLKVSAKKGDFFYLPAGTVHALGPGLVVAEIQTPSDTTFRLYDWGRVDPKTGKPRELHIDKALASIKLYDWRAFELDPAIRTTGLLAEAPTFDVYKRFAPQGHTEDIFCVDPEVWVIIEGNCLIKDSVIEEKISAGTTILIPPAAEEARVEFLENTTYLVVHLKSPQKIVDFIR